MKFSNLNRISIATKGFLTLKGFLTVKIQPQSRSCFFARIKTKFCHQIVKFELKFFDILVYEGVLY